MSEAVSTADAPAPVFHWPVRVYWEDTDAGGIVYYANYLRFFERARTEWLRQAGVEQSLLAQREGLLFVVTEANLRYRAAARLDDQLDLHLSVTELGPASLAVQQQAWRCDTAGAPVQLLVQALVRVGCVRADAAGAMRPARLPAELRPQLQRWLSE